MFDFAGCGQIFQKRRFFSLQSIDRAVDIGCRRVEAELGGGRDDRAVLSANGDFKFIKWVHGRSPRAPDEFFPIRCLANRDLDSVSLLHRLPPLWWAVVLDMTSLAMSAFSECLTRALGRRAPFASGLWIIMVAAVSRIPLSFFLQPPCYSTPLSSYSYFCRS